MIDINPWLSGKGSFKCVGRLGFDSGRVMKLSAAPRPFFVALSLSVHWRTRFYLSIWLSNIAFHLQLSTVFQQAFAAINSESCRDSFQAFAHQIAFGHINKVLHEKITNHQKKLNFNITRVAAILPQVISSLPAATATGTTVTTVCLLSVQPAKAVPECCPKSSTIDLHSKPPIVFLTSLQEFMLGRGTKSQTWTPQTNQKL